MPESPCAVAVKRVLESALRQAAFDSPLPGVHREDGHGEYPHWLNVVIQDDGGQPAVSDAFGQCWLEREFWRDRTELSAFIATLQRSAQAVCRQPCENGACHLSVTVVRRYW